MEKKFSLMGAVPIIFTIGVNEMADIYAKKGTEGPFIGPTPSFGFNMKLLRREIEKWTRSMSCNPNQGYLILDQPFIQPIVTCQYYAGCKNTTV